MPFGVDTTRYTFMIVFSMSRKGLFLQDGEKEINTVHTVIHHKASADTPDYIGVTLTNLYSSGSFCYIFMIMSHSLFVCSCGRHDHTQQNKRLIANLPFSAPRLAPHASSTLLCQRKGYFHSTANTHYERPSSIYCCFKL